jgi:hypothetical protein
MDDIGRPVLTDSLERALFGGLPTAWLQAHIYELAPTQMGIALAAIHGSWFVFPWFVGYHVTYWHRSLVPSYFANFLLVWLLAMPVFALFPMEPPWMADATITRVLATVVGHEGSDPNPFAAMPSLHVALPLAVAIWSMRRGLSGIGVICFGYTFVIASEVVISGEHYIVDVLGAGALAIAAVMLGEVLMNGVRRPTAVPKTRGVAVARAESGQNLVEFAFISPLLILMIGAIIMVALGLHTRSNLQQAVREAARQVAVGNTANADDIGSGNSGGTLSASEIKWCRPPGSNGQVGDEVRAYVDETGGGTEGYSYTIIPSTGIFQAMGVNSLSVTMSPRATARLEKSLPGLPACP